MSLRSKPAWRLDRFDLPMTITFFEKSPQGVREVPRNQSDRLDPARFIWVDMLSPDANEEALVETSFGIDAPSEAERAALEESARFYIENDVLVLNATVMARQPPAKTGRVRTDLNQVQHHRQIVSFFLTDTTLITVRNCPLRAFEINAGRASANLTLDQGPGDILVSLLESLIERAADHLGASATELESLNIKVLIGHKQVRLETILRRLGQLGAGASQTRDSLASLSRLVRFCVQHLGRFHLPAERLSLLMTDIDTLQRQVDALKTDLTFVLDSTLGLVSRAKT
ncbi:MAG: hypothetical protein HC777_03540, partial [Hyphomonadaceae bacterium]|nr:hypothetical protein [Hyphomonadaceae bacterium]